MSFQLNSDRPPLPAAAAGPAPVPSPASSGANRGREWAEIMGQLRGLKLEVYDDIVNGRKPVDTVMRIQEALGWLVYHRFIWKDGATYVAREVPRARDLWAKEGAARQEAADVARALPPLAAAGPAPETPGEPAATVLHRMRPGQPELFS